MMASHKLDLLEVNREVHLKFEFASKYMT